MCENSFGRAGQKIFKVRKTALGTGQKTFPGDRTMSTFPPEEGSSGKSYTLEKGRSEKLYPPEEARSGKSYPPTNQ